MERAVIDQHIARFGKLKSERLPWEKTWQTLSEYIAPRNTQLFSHTKSLGGNEPRKALSLRPEQLNNMLASTMGAMLTNRNSQWYRFDVPFFDPQSDSESALYLYNLESTVYSVMQNSNLYTELDEVYRDSSGLGTAVIQIEEDDDDVVRFSARSISECFIAEDAKGRVDTLYRCFKLSVRNLIQMFDNLPDKYIKEASKDPDKLYEVLHCTYRRNDRDAEKRDSKNKPYASTWLLLADKHLLKESGYDEFPFAVVRFAKVTGETYGRGPGHTALPAILHVNEVEKTAIKARQLETLPPLFAKEDNLLSKVKLTPGGMTFVRDLEDAPRPLNTGANSRAADLQIDHKMKEISDAFFFDVIMTQDSGTPRTATEIMQRTDERAKILVSAASRYEQELLEPLINRVIGICARKGLFPKPPSVLAQALHRNGQKLKIRFTSPLSKSQVVHEANSIIRTFESLAQLAQLGVDPYDHLDMDVCKRIITEAFGVPPNALKSQDKVNKEREEKAKQMQAMQQGQALDQVASGLEKAGRAEAATKDTKGPVAAALQMFGDKLREQQQ